MRINNKQLFIKQKIIYLFISFLYSDTLETHRLLELKTHFFDSVKNKIHKSRQLAI